MSEALSGLKRRQQLYFLSLSVAVKITDILKFTSDGLSVFSSRTRRQIQR